MASGNARIQGPEEANYKTFTLTHAHLTQTPPENNHSAGDSSQFTISRSFFQSQDSLTLLSGMQAGAKDVTFGSWSHRVLPAIISTVLWKSHRPSDITTGWLKQQIWKTGKWSICQYHLHSSINIAYKYIHNIVFLNWMYGRPSWRETFNHMKHND